MSYKNIALLVGRYDIAWQSLLDSEGVPWIMENTPLHIEDVPILVLTQKASDLMRSFARSILYGGGVVIAEHRAFPLQQSANQERIFFLYDRNTFTGIHGDKNHKAIELIICRNQPGTIIYLPFDLNKFWCNRLLQRQYICTEENESPQVWEELPVVSKKNVRRVVNEILKMAFHATGLPFVQKSYWPEGSRTVFCFRADMDGGNKDSLLRFIDAVRPWSKSLSMFVCGQSYFGKTDLLKKTMGLECELGNHTYTHYVYKNSVNNCVNIELTERILETVGIYPQGYIGPASFWHPSMYDVLQEKGYQYTSSFGVDHDNLPYFPIRNSRDFYDLVEIPFHCLGDRFTKFGMRLDSPKVFGFFEHLIEKKYMAAEPIAIYGHPDMKDRLGNYPELVERICEKALSLPNVWTGNMAELAKWWRKRHAVNAAISFDSSSGVIHAKNIDTKTNIFWSVLTSDGRWFIEKSSRLKEGIRLDALTPCLPMAPKSSTDIGEIISTSYNTSLISMYRIWRRTLRRKLLKTRELNEARLRLGV